MGSKSQDAAGRRRGWGKYALDEELGAGAMLLADASLEDLPHFRETWRRISASAAETTPPDVVAESVDIEAEGRVIPARIYRPAATATSALPAILLLHSGAFVGGSTASVHGQCAALSSALQSIVVAVDYRLAPENPFPAGLDDCVQAYLWMAEDAGGLGIDVTRIALHGVSAGGGLAVALALRARDEGLPAIRFLFVVSPELDDRLTSKSMERFTDTPGFSSGDAQISWRLYLGDQEPGGDAVSPYAAPARAESYVGLPTTYLALMEFDPLRDEGLAFAQRLLHDGVPLELHLFPGTFHGSSALAYAEVSRRELAEEIAVFRRRLLGA